MTTTVFGKTVNYTVQPGDYYWLISQKYSLDFHQLMRDNNGYSNPYLYVGQTLKVTYDDSNRILHRVEAGHTFWKISDYYKVDLIELMALNNADQKPYLAVGELVIVPKKQTQSTGAYVTYTNYTVKQGDIIWDIAVNHGIPYTELLEANQLNEYSSIYPGMVLKVPVHHVPVKSTPGGQYGEYLDWWTEAQYVIPINKTFTVRDYYSGKTWKMKRTIGANHADCEPVTYQDSQMIKSVWGGSFSWARRPVLIWVDGRQIAASMSAMPHDIQYITNNGITGHMDIHFANSTRHSDGQIDYDHQYNIKVAAGKYQ